MRSFLTSLTGRMCVGDVEVRLILPDAVWTATGATPLRGKPDWIIRLRREKGERKKNGRP